MHYRKSYLADSWSTDSVPPVSWPLSKHSQFVQTDSIRWHVQRLGRGPTMLLLHGTGSSTHSWQKLALRLSDDFDIVMCDLPGHGFTLGASKAQLSLPGISRCINQLLQQLGVEPEICIGHSAGAAIMCQLTLDSLIKPNRLIGLNSALVPFEGFGGHLFAPLAQLLANNSMLPRLVGWHARRSQMTKRLLAGTGSRLGASDVNFYETLLQNPAHVAGALGMMANWDLYALTPRLSALNVSLLLLAGANDRTISPREAGKVAMQLTTAESQMLPNLGHLAHEEDPAQCEIAIRSWLSRTSKVSTNTA